MPQYFKSLSPILPQSQSIVPSYVVPIIPCVEMSDVVTPSVHDVHGVLASSMSGDNVSVLPAQ